MPHVTIEIDRGNGWQVRCAGETDATPDQMRTALRDYALQYPHRVIVGDLLLVALPRGPINPDLVSECHAHAGEHGAGIEFIT